MLVSGRALTLIHTACTHDYASAVSVMSPSRCVHELLGHHQAWHLTLMELLGWLPVSTGSHWQHGCCPAQQRAAAAG
jgi:hypothetical protein